MKCVRNLAKESFSAAIVAGECSRYRGIEPLASAPPVPGVDQVGDVARGAGATCSTERFCTSRSSVIRKVSKRWRDLLQRRQAGALQDLDEEQLEARPVPVHQELHVVVVELGDAPPSCADAAAVSFAPGTRGAPRTSCARPSRSSTDCSSRAVKSGKMSRPSTSASKAWASWTTDCWKQSFRMPWLFSTRVADVVGLARDRDVHQLRVDHLLELERDAVDERVVDLVERRVGVECPAARAAPGSPAAAASRT